jgi:hypothetical protein
MQVGLALDPCVHLRQLPLLQRAPSFRALPFGACPHIFDPDHDAIDNWQSPGSEQQPPGRRRSAYNGKLLRS